MNVELEIEKKVINLLSPLLPDVKVRGAWSYAFEGEVQNVEDGKDFLLDIKVSSPTYATFTIPMGEWAVTMNLFVPCLLDPTGEKISSYYEVISEQMMILQSSIEAVQSAFTVEDGFIPHGFMLSGGEVPEIVDAEKTLPITFILRGRRIV